MPSVNGQEYQHAAIDFQISNTGGTYQIVTFQKISYKQTAEKKVVNDAQGQPIGYTIDNLKNEASISMLLSEWFKVKKFLLDQNPGLGVGQIPFDATVTFGSSLSTLVTETLSTVLFNEDPRDSSSDQSALMVELPLFVLKITDKVGNTFVNYPQPISQQ